MAIISPNFEFEQGLAQEREGIILAGLDEAGRGPLAGPVVAAAVVYKQPDFSVPEDLDKDFAFIRDSKTLSEKRREKMFAIVQEYFYSGMGIIYPETIDRVNILEATFLAMKEAVQALRSELKRKGIDPSGLHVLVDGNQLIPNFSGSQESVVSGDRIVKSIAAASILAKVIRDRMLVEYDAEWPEYGFAKHKGYGTREHMRALEQHGPLPIHRQSFGPVKQAAIRFRELGIIR